MSEVQSILIWLHDTITLSDSEVAKLCKVSRETINRLRKGNTKGETGKSILPLLRKVALQFDMPDYSPVQESQPQSKRSAPEQKKESAPAQNSVLQQPTPIATRSLPRATMPIARDTNRVVVTRSPVQQKPKESALTQTSYPLLTFREYDDFMCVKCHTLQIARRDTGKKCTNCGHPYHLRMNAFLEEKMLAEKTQQKERIKIRRI